MSGDANIIAEVVEGALVIPETALRYRGDQIYVDWVNRNGVQQVDSRDIEIGIVDGTRVQVLNGLDEGEEVRLQ
jgi:HlyD family secretion protein